LGTYINHLQDDQSNWLPLAEFVANNLVCESTGVLPFFANAEQDPKVVFDLNQPTPMTETFEAEKHVTQLQEIHEVAHLNMQWAEDRYKENADHSRILAPAFQVGDTLW
jgi:hypothetical protein